MRWPVSVAGDTFIFYPMPQVHLRQSGAALLTASKAVVTARLRAPLQIFLAGALHQREGAVNFVVETAAAIPQH